MTKLVSPSQNPVIRKYLKDVLAWHGYIRFLGMPTLQTNPDVPIDELYVAQSLSLENLPTDKEPKSEQLHNPVKLLLEKHHLVVLGDPGSGKSTLINWFAWQLASGFVDRLPKELSELIPIPIVLRELHLDSVINFETLIDSFLDRPLAKALKGKKDLVLEFANQGKLIFLVDGLDEVSLDVRRKLQVAFNEIFVTYNKCCSIFTSRKVGYELAPIGVTYGNIEDEDSKRIIRYRGISSSYKNIVFHSNKKFFLNSLLFKPAEYYVAPFTNNQISQFSLNWYREYITGNEDGVQLLRDEFIASIKSNESTLQLARTPHLLTMMALIFKVRLQLPNGRALLYELIAQAYLESIDTARKLKDPFLWQEKKRWLARVAFEMQMQRVNKENKRVSKNRELLASREEVLEWITSAIKDSYSSQSVNTDDYASRYLDWIARRSGLLLPRGENQFAFLHLSFQEYFSAVYVQQQIENPEYYDGTAAEILDERFCDKPLKNWIKDRDWQQVFVFLFEIMAEKPGWIKRLWTECFGRSVEIQRPNVVNENIIIGNIIFGFPADNIGLKVSLLSNPHVGPFNRNFASDLDDIISVSFKQQQEIHDNLSFDFLHLISRTSLSMILDIDSWRAHVLSKVSSEFLCDGIFLQYLDFDVLVAFLEVVEKFEKVKTVSLGGCYLDSISRISKFVNIESLFIEANALESLAGIASFKKLKHLSISLNSITDLSELKDLQFLEDIRLDGLDITNYSPLFELSNLKTLAVSGVDDISFLLKISTLEVIYISSSPRLNDISVLEEHSSIKEINLVGFKSEDINLGNVESMAEVIFM